MSFGIVTLLVTHWDPQTRCFRPNKGQKTRKCEKSDILFHLLYHSLLKLFVDINTNKDGLVSKASFSKLIDIAATLPKAYGYVPADSDLYNIEAEKVAARQKMFNSIDLKSTGVIYFDEWLKFCREHIAAKTATIDPHPFIDEGSVDKYKKFITK